MMAGKTCSEHAVDLVKARPGHGEDRNDFSGSSSVETSFDVLLSDQKSTYREKKALTAPPKSDTMGLLQLPATRPS